MPPVQDAIYRAPTACRRDARTTISQLRDAPAAFCRVSGARAIWHTMGMNSTCPMCGRALQGGPRECPACGAQSYSRLAVTSWRTVHVARSEWEANLVRTFLEANEVPARVRGSTAAVLRLPGGASGVEVVIPDQAYGRALEVLAGTPAAGRLNRRVHRELAEFRISAEHEARALRLRTLLWVLAAIMAGAAVVASFAAVLQSLREGDVSAARR